MKQLIFIFFGIMLTLSGVETGIPREEVIPSGELSRMMKNTKYPFWQTREFVYGMKETDQKNLKECYLKDPVKAKQMILDGMDQKQKNKQELASKIRKSAEEYRSCNDPEQKKVLKENLKRLLQEQFDNTSSDIRTQLELQERRLYDIRKAYEKRISGASKQIESQFHRLTKTKNQSRKKNIAKNKNKEKNNEK